MTAKQLEDALTRAYRMGAASVKAPDLIGHIQAEFAGFVLDQCAKAEQPPQWQPIETAPKDGWFLAFKPGVAHIVGTILDSDHPDCEFDGGVHEAWSHQHVDGITHWMPLPAKPISLPSTET